MKTCKRLLFLLVLVLGFGLLPTGVKASALEDPVITYDMWVSGVQVSTANASDVLNDGGSVRFDGDTDTLILTNANILLSGMDGTRDAVGIYNGDLYEDGLTISLVGSNQIVMPWYGSNMDCLMGICSRNSALTIEGTGSLSISLTGRQGQFIYGLWLDNGEGSDELVIDGVSLSMDLVSTARSTDAGVQGIYTWHSPQIIDADIDIDISADAGVVGINAFKDVTLDGSTVDVTVDPNKTISNFCYGMKLDSNTLTLTGASTLTLSSGSVEEEGESYGIAFLCGLFAFGPGAISVEDGSAMYAQALGGTGTNVGASFLDSGLVVDVSSNSLLQIAGSTQALDGAYLDSTTGNLKQGFQVSSDASGTGAAPWDGEAELISDGVRFIRFPGGTMRIVVDFGFEHESFVSEFYDAGGSYSTSGKYNIRGSKVTFPVGQGVTVLGALRQVDIADEMIGYVDGGELFPGQLALQTIDAYDSWDDLEQEAEESGHDPAVDGQVFHALWFSPAESVEMTLEAPVAGTIVDAAYNEYGVIESQEPMPEFTCTGDAYLDPERIQAGYWLAEMPDSVEEDYDLFDGIIRSDTAYYACTTILPGFGYFFPFDEDAQMYYSAITVNGEPPAKVLQDSYSGALDVFAAINSTGDPVTRSFLRLAGAGRYETGAEIAGVYDAHGGTVILATGDNFPDALCASALAGKEHAPILMTSSTSLSAATEATLASVQPEFIIVVGGTGAVSDSVLEAACAAAGIPCDDEHTARYFGANRYATGVKIYEQGRLWSDTCIIATGGNFADALSISPYAYATATPIFLVDDKTHLLDADTVRAISDEFSRMIIVGGTGVVSGDVAGQLDIRSDQVVRLAGSSRYDTSLAIARWEMGLDTDAFFGPDKVLGMSSVSLATGANFPDALTGGALCGKRSSVLLLVSEKAADYQGALDLVSAGADGIKRGYVFGGTGAVSDTLKAKFDAVLN